MKMIKKVLVFCILTLIMGILVAPAMAQNNVGARLRRQQHRINRGVRTGALTHREHAQLQRHENHLRRQVARYRRRNGGVMTAREHGRVERELNRSSARIYRKKHNAAVR